MQVDEWWGAVYVAGREVEDVFGKQFALHDIDMDR